MYPSMQADQAQGGPPPELLAQLMGGLGSGGGAPQQDQQPDGDAAIDHLRQAIEHAQAALQLEPDDADSQMLAKVVQGLYQILAQRQKEHEQLLGGSNIRALSRSAA